MFSYRVRLPISIREMLAPNMLHCYSKLGSTLVQKLVYQKYAEPEKRWLAQQV